MKKLICLVVVMSFLAAGLVSEAYAWNTIVDIAVSTFTVTGNGKGFLKPEELIISSASSKNEIIKVGLCNDSPLEQATANVITLWDNFSVGAGSANVTRVWTVVMGTGTYYTELVFDPPLDIHRGLAIRKTNTANGLQSLGNVRASVMYK